MKYIGYHRKDALPIKAGDLVRIPKGVMVKSVYKDAKPNGRLRTVKVHHVLSGYTDAGRVVNPSVRWAGSGGYWSEADINDVEKVPNEQEEQKA